MKRIFCLLIIAFSLCSTTIAGGFFTNRFFEYKICIPADVSNNSFAISDFLQKNVVIDLKKLADDVPSSGFGVIVATNPNMQVNLKAGPVFVGIESGFDVYSKLGISKSLFELIGYGNEDKDNVDIEGNFFFDSFQYNQVNVGIKFKRFSINVTPGLFFPIATTGGNKISASFSNDKENGSISFKANALVDTYAITDIQKIIKGGNNGDIIGEFKFSAGFDVGGGFSMPLSNRLTVSATARLPLVPGTLHSKQSIKYDVNYSVNIMDLGTGSGKGIKDATPNFDVNFGAAEATEYKVRRPMFIMGYLDFYPLFGTNLLSLRAGIGVGVRHPFAADAIGYFNYYTGATVNLIDVLKVTASMSYMDRIFKNQIELAINARIIEFDIGASLQSANFLKSWQGAGFGAYVNFAMGF